MDLLSLKLLVRDDDINQLLTQHTPRDVPVRDLQVKLTPAGVRVSGRYPTALFSVRFETTWQLETSAGRLVARLVDLDVAGMPASMVRGVLMEKLAEAVAGRPGVAVVDDTLTVDFSRLLAQVGLTGRMALSAIECRDGALILEGGN